ncbi:SIS domain-containing protein [Micromonospora sp. GCM10011542]|uniref:SIS domain-containing protein n=1 Tax=Micromonospora sp. GCM10011542 TaxID=3317337 RepID=UPI003607F408
MTTALERTIHTQAEAIEHMARTDLAEPAQRLRDARRVLLIGTGTSRHAADLGALLLRDAGVEAYSFAAEQFVTGGPTLFPDDAAVVISHTGRTAYSRRARETARRAGCRLVTITGEGAGWPEAIVTVPPEESETYTASYTACLAVLASLAHHLGCPDVSPADLARAARHVRAVCATYDPGAMRPPERALGLVGAGPYAVTAAEGALKLREAAGVLAEGFDAERLLHGAAVPYGRRDRLLLVAPEADADGLVPAIGAAAAAEGVPVSTVPGVTGLHPMLAQLPVTVALQLLAAELAQLNRRDPDRVIVGAWAEESLWERGSEPGAAATPSEGSGAGAR